MPEVSAMSDRPSFRSRPALQWQLVLVNPTLLRAAQRRLRASGPSHAIEEALRLAAGPAASDGRDRSPPPVH